MTHAPLPRIELRAFSMDGSREIAVTHDGLLTYKRFVQQQLEPLHTLQLTDAQIDELSAAAAAALQTRSRAEHFMDYRIFHTVGNEAFDDDGPNPRFNRINAVLWRLVRAYEPEPED